ncbi:T6SS phospholipase effector Tle1-like catalytic domain-containing protein [Luteimonas sp. A501]
MTDFRRGWYGVRRQQDGSLVCYHFTSWDKVSQTCLILSNGDQLSWWAAEGPHEYRTETWSSDYEPLSRAPSGDTWDNHKYASGGPQTEIPAAFSRIERKPTPRELSQRASKASFCGVDGLACTREIHVGMFFDGTNNNLYRDKPKSHSNIVSLYDAHRDDRVEHFAYYIPGVGTRFPEIGELVEDSKGKSMARGGEARIHWAMLQVYNAVCASVTGFDLLTEDEMMALVTKTVGGLRTWYRVGDAKLRPVFSDIDRRLVERLGEARPVINRIHLSVFGFSRGAAEARVFCNWIRQATDGKVGPALLNLRFLGIYDTVASVLLADSSPVGRGFFDWAHNSLGIDGVEAAVHYQAGHEIRRSFPLSTARAGGRWPANTREFVYPGAHSDIGGGYAPGDQGKAPGARAQLMSQIPLNDMFFAASNGGAKLQPLEEMEGAAKADFAVDPALDQAFSAYAAWTAPSEKEENLAGSRRGVVEDRMQTQTQLYWRWRASKAGDDRFKAMRSWSRASAQDRQDLWESELDWRRDVERARAAHLPRRQTVVSRGGLARTVERPPAPSQTQRDLVKAIDSAASIPPEVDRFFDEYVHDSHAGFWLLGPMSEWDKSAFVNEIHRKQKARQAALQRARRLEENGNYEAALAAHAEAARYELNNFEKRVVQSNPTPVSEGQALLPLMTDADAADLRDNMGFEGTVVKYGMGSGTRREANGHGQYRRIFDQDNEIFDVFSEAGDALERAGEAVSDKWEDLKSDVDNLRNRAVEGAKEAINDAAESAKDAVIDGAKRRIGDLIPSGIPRIR